MSAKRNVPTPEQMENVRELVRNVAAFWTHSIDYHGKQCRTLIMANSLTERLDFAPMDLPIHQVTEVRDREGNRLL